jgi:phosphopantothenoylcysteine decarboxylase/phosphopantothenate--cysteine ligase
MGYAIAEHLAELGAKVILVSGPVSINLKHKSIELINVVSAKDMYREALARFKCCDGAVMSAAVADYSPVKKSAHKVKREKGNYTLELQPNPDIAAALGEIKRENQVLIGFALETDNEEENAVKKLRKKNLDFIVLNSLREAGAGFQHDTNKIVIIDKNSETFRYSLKPKIEVARDIVEKLIEIQHIG